MPSTRFDSTPERSPRRPSARDVEDAMAVLHFLHFRGVSPCFPTVRVNRLEDPIATPSAPVHRSVRRAP